MSPRPEDERDALPAGAEPQFPSALPVELADFLRTQDLACVLQATDRGSLYVLKVPAAELTTLHGTFRIGIEHALHRHPSAPVIRTVITFYDQPDSPLRLESFTNPADTLQRADFAALAEQDELLLLFYDESLTHRLSKRLATPNHAELGTLLAHADRLLATMPQEGLDFARAKAAVMEATRL